jgi:glycine/D-amino acid oxidase-like deaminating enzyme
MLQKGIARPSSQSLPDVLIVGAGIMGLWAARKAILAGRRVMVVDADKAGGGASGGFVGALMPHMPDRWDEKSDLQFEGLVTLDRAIAELEDETGRNCGFRRCGRIIPIRHADTLQQIHHRIRGAQTHWPGYAMELLAPPYRETQAAWLDEAAAPFGAQFDSLSARVNPRVYVGALTDHVRSRATLLEGARVVEIDGATPKVRLADGTVLAAGSVVVAAGWQAYGLLLPFMAGFATAGRLGQGVKGQAVLMRFKHDDDRPILFDDGNYIVPHADDLVAVGATSRGDWQAGRYGSPGVFDPDDTGFLQRATEMMPALDRGTVVEEWAGVRPRNRLKGRGTEPYCGRVPGYENLSALIGGFKIGLAIAHVDFPEMSEALPI